MPLRFLILALIAVSAFGQAFVTTNMVTRLPLPWGGVYTNQTRLRMREAQFSSVITNGELPAAPSHVRAKPPTHVLLRWDYSPDVTNIAFVVYQTTNLTTWTPIVNFAYNVRAVAFPASAGVRGFFTVAASNEAGQVFTPRTMR